MKLSLDKPQWLKIIGGTLLIIALVFLVIGITTSRQSPPPKMMPAQPEKLYQAWVVTDHIDKGMIITRDIVRRIATPEFSDEFIQDSEVALGRRVKNDVAAGTYLTDNLLYPNRPVIDDLAQNYRAIAIKAGEVLTVGGYLKPGDYVDVMLLLKPNKESGSQTSARTIATSLMVLAIGDQQQPLDGVSRAENARSVVLAVPEGMAPMMLLADTAGDIRLAAVGSKELALNNQYDSEGRSTGMSMSSTTHSAQANHMAELKQFSVAKKADVKAPRVTPKKPPQAQNAIEVIQGNQRSVVTFQH